MRRLFVGLVVAATSALAPLWAMAANQETADQIAGNLRGGQLQDYKIGVKYQDGTAWLDGSVGNSQQMATAVRIASHTPGVTRVINNLTVSSTGIEQNETGMAARLQRVVQSGAARATLEPLAHADPLPSSYAAAPTQSRPAMSRPIPVAYMQQAGPEPMMQTPGGGPMPAHAAPLGGGVAPACYDQPSMPNYAWPSYASYPNYAGVTYPKQYSPTAWPFIGPFYPYPQVPLGWRKVTLEWDDGWWMLDFKD